MSTPIRRLHGMMRIATCIAVLLAGGAAGLPAQGPAGTVEPRSNPLLWANAGGGFSTRGLALLAGGGISYRGWALEGKALATNELTNILSYSGNYALMAGRTLGASQRGRIVAGLVTSKITRHEYRPGGIFGNLETVYDEREVGLAVTLATRSRSAYLLAAGVELTGFLSPNNSFLGVSGVIALGK